MSTQPLSTTQSAREARARRRASTLGYVLVKSRAHDTTGLYVLVGDTAGNRIGRRGGQAALSDFANGLGVTLDGIERELSIIEGA